MIIRKATLEDLDFIMSEVADDMFARQGDLDLRDNEYMSTKLIPFVITEGVCLIAEKDGELVGSIAGLVVPTLYNPNKTNLAEIWWWVKEKHRSGSVGAKLLFMFEIEAEEKEVDYITMSILPTTQLNTEAFAKRGYEVKEYAYGRKM